MRSRRRPRSDTGLPMVWSWNSGRPRSYASLLRLRTARFIDDEAAGTMTIFALTLPVVIAAAGAAVDYSRAASTRTKMQAAADSAALASARELQLARMDASRITAIANNVVNSTLQNVATKVDVDFKAMTVKVDLEKQYKPFILVSSATQLHASATAKMSGSMPLCLLALDRAAPETVGLKMSARLTAPGCLVQSNSKNIFGMLSQFNAVLKAGMICSSGGIVLTVLANYSPAPNTDCPVLADPLSSRAEPPIGGCNYTNKVVDGISATLLPGVYCGGLRLTNGAVAKLSS